MNRTLSVGVVLACVMVAGPGLAQDTGSSMAPDMSSSMAPMSPAPDLSSSAPASASEMPAPDQAVVDEWQGVVSAQIVAFRTHDAPGALKYASAPFHASFTDPEKFYAAIIASGYGPIVTSKSESFGPFQMVADGMVLQDVKLTGTDQSVYEAIYQLTKEADGWRVAGVQMVKTPAIGV
jgi:hypothetical protein